jgi:signal transduction histidine kinase/CheY-like chemotaxis protein
MPMKLLIADDEPQLRSLLRVYFESQGWEVTCASSGSEALELLEKAPFDVILTDVRMPGASGLEVLKAVRSRIPHGQVILMTGYRNLKAAIEAVNRGAFAYIEKPFSLTDLRERVNEALRAKQESEAQEQERHALEMLVERKEEEISLLKERSKVIFDEMPARIALVDQGGFLRDANQGFFQDFGAEGRKASQVHICVALNCPQAVDGPCESPCELWDRMTKCMALGSTSGKFILRPPFGSSPFGARPIYQVAIIALPQRNPSDQRPKEFVLLMEDVTKEKLMEMQLLHSSKLASLGEMASGIAHELSQPLNAISAQSQLLRFMAEKGEKISRDTLLSALGDITEQVFKVSEILQHLRLYGHKSAREQREMIRARDIVDASLRLIRSQIRAWGIDLVVEEEDGIPPIHGSLHELSHALTNILINARDAIRERFSSEPESPSSAKEIRVRIGALSKNGHPWVLLEVWDNGIGMEEKVLDKAFDPMYSTKEDGTGIGLPIAASIVHAHGGEIRVQSEPYKGTKVTIELPCSTSGL